MYPITNPAMLKTSWKKPCTAAKTTFNRMTTTISQSAAVMILSCPLSGGEVFLAPSRGVLYPKRPRL
jgi:hypothetical protein